MLEDRESALETIITLSNLLGCINSATNFLMYMVRGIKFRHVFLQTYACRPCCHKEDVAVLSGLAASKGVTETASTVID